MPANQMVEQLQKELADLEAQITGLRKLEDEATALRQAITLIQDRKPFEAARGTGEGSTRKSTQERRDSVLAALRGSRGSMTAAQLRDRLGVSGPTVQNDLKALIVVGTVRKEDRGKYVAVS